MANYLVSYRPLCLYKKGSAAAELYNQPKFVDHSTRREPELELPFPGVSSICRAGKFAPRLEEGDILVYITVRGNYFSTRKSHWRLVAILRVVKKCWSHEEAAEWYGARGLRVPSNCIVEGSDPLPKRLTALECYTEETYHQRVAEDPEYLICEPEYVNLTLPPAVQREDWMRITGRIPPTETPTTVTDEELKALRKFTLQ